MSGSEQIKGALIRRAEVRAILGVSEQVVKDMVEAGTLATVRLTPKGRCFFRRSEVERLAGVSG